MRIWKLFRQKPRERLEVYSLDAGAATIGIPDEVRQQLLAERERLRRYGHIRHLITTTHQEHRFIAVGSRLYFHRNWRTFTDFLFFYVHDVFGREWWAAEKNRPLVERHPVVQWQEHVHELSRTLPRDENGLIAGEPDGIMAAYLLLAYDLYVLRDHSRLQEDVVRRLRIRDQFQGARYELFVAATFIRANFEFSYEDETDQTRRHAEFIGTYRPTGLVVAVEAKARQRMVRQPFDMASIRPTVRQLLLSAADKQPPHPLIVFLELNLPPEDPHQEPTWRPHVHAVVEEIALERRGSPFGAVFFTNRPHLYGLRGEGDPGRHAYSVWPDGSPVPDAVIDALGEATQQYGNVPSRFPDEWNSQ